MKHAPTFDDIFAVMSTSSVGDSTSRVALPDDPDLDDIPTRFGFGLNLLLDDLSFRMREAEDVAERLRILAAAAHDFSAATQDHQQLLDTVALRLTSIVKDQCIVLLASEDGQELRPAAVRALDPEIERLSRQMYVEPVRLDQHPISRQVLGSGEPFFVAKVNLAEIGPRTTPKFFDYMKRIAMHSLLIVPLRVHAQSFGQLILMRYRRESPSFDEHDLALAAALADHAAIAISNARSYAAERAARVVAEKAKEDARASEARYRLKGRGEQGTELGY